MMSSMSRAPKDAVMITGAYSAGMFGVGALITAMRLGLAGLPAESRRMR